MENRRDVFSKLNLSETTNAGLWLDKFIGEDEKKNVKEDKAEGTAKSRLVKEVASIKIPLSYEKFYKCWEASLKNVGAKTRKAEVKGRMVVGLGVESVLETSVALHRTYGVPFIPGSALKGLAAAYAKLYLEWTDSDEQFRVLFGAPKKIEDEEELPERAGYITFFDALFIPDIPNPLMADVMTVHHPDYYGDKKKPPADWDDPTPVSFLSARGSYLIALKANAPEMDEWVAATFEILGYALMELGIGAKTSSGYGRLKLDDPPPDLNKTLTADLLFKVQGMLGKNASSQMPQLITDYWEKIADGYSGKLESAVKILSKAEESGSKEIRKKSWYVDVKSYIERYRK